MINGIQREILKDFIPPEPRPLRSFEWIRHFAFNILSYGTCGVQENRQHSFRILRLEKEQKILIEEIVSLYRHCHYLEKGLANLSKECNFLYHQISKGKIKESQRNSKFKHLEKRIDQFLENHPASYPALVGNKRKMTPLGLKGVALEIAYHIKIWIIFFSTLGIYTSYRNYHLKNRFELLKAENQYLKAQKKSLVKFYHHYFDNSLHCLKNSLKTKQDLIGIQHTDAGRAYFLASNLKRQLGSIEIERQNLQKRFDQLSQDHTALEIEVDLLKEDQKELLELRQHVQHLNTQIKQTALASADIENLQPELNLSKRLGPITPKYIPKREELDEFKGANGIGEEVKKDFWSAYARRYNGIKTAPELFKKGFAYALKEMFKMAEHENKKIKLNKSLGTPQSRGAQAVYRFLALDWINGGVPLPTCHNTYEFHLNNQGVKLVSSRPERVLKYQEKSGKAPFAISLHFQDRDDFTPSEDELSYTSAARGIEPLAAACLLKKISIEERKHLFHLLMEPVIEDDHPDYVETLKFIHGLSKERREWIDTLRDLISDIGVVLEKKFAQNIAIQEWQKYLDAMNFSLQPFVKRKEEILLEENLEDQQVVPWQLNYDALAVIKKNVSQQSEFLELLLNIQAEYQTYFKHFQQNWLKEPFPLETEMIEVTWDHIEKQYHKVHNLIGMQGCLFSNLLTLFVTSLDDLTEDNIFKLKKAMAAYLDIPEHSEQFASALLESYGCTVEQYQQWLRNKPNCVRIDSDNLTTVHIEIVAYTLGVRIALFSPRISSEDIVTSKGKVDAYGRLIPVEDMENCDFGSPIKHYFGPPTAEVFFMAVNAGVTYQALFPKLEPKSFMSSKINLDDLKAIKKIHNYWQESVNNSFE